MTATEKPTAASLVEHTPSAYSYPLLVKHLPNSTPAQAADQEIVYRDLRRLDYRTLRQRIGQLASGLVRLGVKPGTTVAVMDWDSHRYLECFFAVPMLGAIEAQAPRPRSRSRLSTRRSWRRFRGLRIRHRQVVLGRRGAFRTSQPCWASSRCTRVATAPTSC